MMQDLDYFGAETDFLDLQFDQNDGILADTNPASFGSDNSSMSFPILGLDDEFGEDIFKIFNDFDQPFEFDLPNPLAAATDGTQVMSYPSPFQSICPHDSDHLYCKPSEEFSIPLCCNQSEASPMGLESLTASPSGTSDSSMLAVSDVVSNPEDELSSFQGDFLLGDNNDGHDFFSFLLQDIIPGRKDPSELVNQPVLQLPGADSHRVADAFDVEISVGDPETEMNYDYEAVLKSWANDSPLSEISVKPCETMVDSLLSKSNFDDIEIDHQNEAEMNQDYILSDEEKALLAQEGIELPIGLPLTKAEERALKIVRRKIKNKMSAKESRKRKQEYVDNLEKRVKLCSDHNRRLEQKVDSLEKQNNSLMNQLKNLHAVIKASSISDMLSSIQNIVPLSQKQAQPGTFVMVLALSFALILVPHISPFFRLSESGQLELNEKSIGSGRMLLYSAPESKLYSREYSKVPYPFGPSNEPLETLDGDFKHKDALDTDRLNDTANRPDAFSNDGPDNEADTTKEADKELFSERSRKTEGTVEMKLDESSIDVENGSFLQMDENLTVDWSPTRNDL